ncbi:Periphilin-1 [Schistosoma japonicum]|nr:Periphilin-1 [Schistosoma japonicum]KAH8871887.1 Periphilin-1 [Schistosoma japonicum]KAH8871890.1 Periphilin-1 [Schistosoma japonicum]
MRSGVRLDDFLLTKGAFGALRRVLHRLATMGMLGGSGQVPPPLVVEGIETTIEIGEAWIAGVLIVGAWIEEVLIGGARNAEVLTEEARNKEVFQEVDLLQALLPGVLVIQADLSQDQCLAQGSPSINEQNLAFSNAPAPNAEGGSSLVSGLIQLRHRGQQGFEQSPAHGGNFSRTRHSSENSSSNASVASSSGAFDSPRNRSARKRMHSISPPYNDRSRNTKAKTEAATSTESLREPPHTRSKTQRTSLQKTPVSENSTTIRQANASRKHRSSAVKGNQKSSVKDTSPTVEKNASKNSHDSRRSDATRSPLSLTSHSTKRWRTPEDDVNDDHLRKEEKWPSANSKSSKLKQKSLVSSANNSSDNDHSDTSKVDGNQVTVSRNSNGKEKESLKPMPKKSNHSSNNNNRSNAVVSAPAVTNEVNESGDFSDDVINLIRDHKNALAEDYKRDCEAFTTVVRMLISKDQDLESRLMPMLKEILHERGQRCIEDLRAFISDHQANESSTNESIEKNHVD